MRRVERCGGAPPVRHDGRCGKDGTVELCGIPYIRCGDGCVRTGHFRLCAGVGSLYVHRHFPAIREEAEQLRRKYNDSLRDSEVFYRGQPDEQFANLYRKWSETPDTKAIILRYMLVIAILLLVPAINLSSMTLSRMRRRMAEIGVRKAFGATGGELIRQIFFENLLLTLFAGVLGLALSYAATFLLNGFLFNNSTNAYLSGETALTPGMLLSPWAFLAAFGFCLLMNILSAGIPAWRASRMNITDAINQR